VRTRALYATREETSSYYPLTEKSQSYGSLDIRIDSAPKTSRREIVAPLFLHAREHAFLHSRRRPAL